MVYRVKVKNVPAKAEDGTLFPRAEFVSGVSQETLDELLGDRRYKVEYEREGEESSEPSTGDEPETDDNPPGGTPGDGQAREGKE